MKNQEYKMTFVIRMMATIFLLPPGLLFISSFDNNKSLSDNLLPLFGFLLFLYTAALWIYHSKKKIDVRNNRIEEHSIFGKKSVKLNSLTSIKYSTVKVNAAGLSGVYAGAAGGGAAAILQGHTKNREDEKFFHINIIVSDGSATIKINSNLKGAAKLRDILIAFEIEVILPRLIDIYQKGYAVHFGPIDLQNGQLIMNTKKLPLDSISEIMINNGILIIKEQEKRWPFLKMPTIKISNFASFLVLLKDCYQPSSG